MAGFLPPISTMQGLGYSAEKRVKRVEGLVGPVNVRPPTSGCSASASPATRPEPVMRFTTPGGRPAFSKASRILKPAIGVSDEGLRTTVLPATSAAAAGAPRSAYGKFQGEMTTQTPKGRSTLVLVSAGESLFIGLTKPSLARICSA
jgi:hypothetical protein